MGGNITRARELSITIALIGEAGRGVTRRDTAQPGDEIPVTGTLGDAALGWRILAGKLKTRGDAKKNRAATKYLVERFPPSTCAALCRAGSGGAAACARRDRYQRRTHPALGHILERSGVGAEIDASQIPISPAYRALMGGDLVHALTGGEDYELIFCVNPGAANLNCRVGCGSRCSRSRENRSWETAECDWCQRAD